MTTMAITKKVFWVPVRLTTSGYIRVEAYCAEDAMEAAQNGDFSPEEGIALQMESHEVTGPPQIEDVS